jgi:hypothetical protein
MKPTSQSAVLLLLCAEAVFGQRLSIGVKGGVPISGGFEGGTQGPVSTAAVLKRYTVGPSAEVALPWKIGLEFSALYSRMGWDQTRQGTPLLEPYRSTTRAGAWDFAAVAKRRFARHAFAGFGPSVRRLFTTRQIVEIDGFTISTQRIAEMRRKNIPGLVFAAGLEWGGRLRVAPEFRYTRWLTNNLYDSFPVSTRPDQAEFLLGFTFGGR